MELDEYLQDTSRALELALWHTIGMGTINGQKLMKVSNCGTFEKW